jgi:hypothetical protein
MDESMDDAPPGGVPGPFAGLGSRTHAHAPEGGPSREPPSGLGGFASGQAIGLQRPLRCRRHAGAAAAAAVGARGS